MLADLEYHPQCVKYNKISSYRPANPLCYTMMQELGAVNRKTRVDHGLSMFQRHTH
jgi:hypothetical protein